MIVDRDAKKEIFMTSLHRRSWEILNPTDTAMPAVKSLYESVLDVDEQIPWSWIERSVARGKVYQTGDRWLPHLIVAAAGEDPERLTTPQGFVYGGLFPDYGGYVCYLGVAPEARQYGLGRTLFEALFAQLREDAARMAVPLPFIIWESHRPIAGATEADRKVWTARCRLFDKVGAMWLSGVDFLSPNYNDDEAPPISLELFVKPIDRPAFEEAELRDVVVGLHRHIYRHDPDDELVSQSLPPGCVLKLQSSLEAERAVGVCSRRILKVS